MKKIGIIGAGPAGLMAAIQVKNEENEVYILERNKKIARKLLMTGGGRCNLTNACFYDDFLENVIRNKKFLYSSFKNFDNFALMDYFKSQEIDLIIEDDLRVFPKSYKSSDIIKFFYEKIDKLGINLINNTKVDYIKKDDKGKFVVESEKCSYLFDYIILACGGLSYKNTGSDGTGYKLAKSFGHKITKTSPVLVPIFFKENLNINALSFENVKISASDAHREYKQIGDILLNRNFITGPAALKLSSYISGKNIKNIFIDFFKDYNYNELDNILLKNISTNPKKTLFNILKSFNQESLISVIFDKLDINRDLRASDLMKDLRHKIIGELKKFSLDFDKLGGFNNAVVTRGGVDIREIDPKTMQSKLVDGLFFVGEILDVDCLTGGFNLQVCFSTAHACAKFIKESI